MTIKRMGAFRTCDSCEPTLKEIENCEKRGIECPYKARIIKEKAKK